MITKNFLNEMIIRSAKEEDFQRILQLNDADVEMLSPLDEKILLSMSELAELFQVVDIDGEVVAFQIIFREGTDYWSGNYKWFCEHYYKFLYVDRLSLIKTFVN